MSLSVFELPATTARFRLVETHTRAGHAWRRETLPACTTHVQVMHVATDQGLEGVCTVGDARYGRMDDAVLDQLRLLVVGENALERERLFDKLSAATRFMFVAPGWFGAFDNCLWDLAGKSAGVPVAALLGDARPSARAYYNISGTSLKSCIEDGHCAVGLGFRALKDHFMDRDGRGDFEAFEAMRSTFPDITLMHDAALARYDLLTALETGRHLEALRYAWFEEPLPDRGLRDLQEVCRQLTLPILAGETLMHDVDLAREWLCADATDMVRANARHGTTAVARLELLARQHGTSIELNGPGGLFGLVHAQLCCGLGAAGRYEYFPGGSRDEVGLEIGLTNPPIPLDGAIQRPAAPGWGAEWDWRHFKRKRLAML